MKILDALEEYGYKDKVLLLCKHCNLNVYTLLHAIKDYRGISLVVDRMDDDRALFIYRTIQSFIAGYIWCSKSNKKYNHIEHIEVSDDICNRD